LLGLAPGLWTRGVVDYAACESVAAGTVRFFVDGSA
jgi:hypothetical protein